MKMIKRLTLLSVMTVFLTSCGLGKNGMSKFHSAEERATVNAQSQIPQSGNVVLFLKDKTTSGQYKRMDFQY